MSEKPPTAKTGDPAACEERLMEAAQWREQLSRGRDESTRASFERWLAASPLNKAAFESVSQTAGFARHAADQPEILALRQQTLARIALNRTPPGGRRFSFLQNRLTENRSQDSKGGFKVAFAAGLAACLAGGIWLAAAQGFSFREGTGLSVAPAFAEALYRTGVGEQATIELADGSQIVLNTDSAVRVAYSVGARRLILDRGQAFFTVARNPRRPFTVEAHGRVVTAFGTAFDVRIQHDTVQVALLEGKVSVGPAGKAQQGAVMLRPNDMLIADRNTLDVIRLENPAAFIAWREGLLIFQNDQLRSAVEEMNRYSATRIVLNDDAVARLRVSGTFRIGQTTAFLEALREMFPVRTERRSAGEIVLTAK